MRNLARRLGISTGLLLLAIAQPASSQSTSQKTDRKPWPERLEDLDVYRKPPPPTEAKFLPLAFKTAELSLNDVDDYASVYVNGRKVDESSGGQTHAFLSITDKLRDGLNEIATVVDNQGGGPCSARVALRLDRDATKVREWLYKRPHAADYPPLCIDERAVFWRYSAPPPGFRRVEIAMYAVDDVMRVTITNAAYNDHVVDASYIGAPKPWKDITQYVRPGENILTVTILNSGGPCRGGLSATIDGAYYLPSGEWYWERVDNPGSPCVIATLHLEVP